MSRLSIDEFYTLIKALPRPTRTFNMGFNYLSTWIETETENLPYGVDLNPDFQRGHVWDETRQIKYMENVLRRIVDDSGLTIRFNCPSWREKQAPDSDLLNQVVCLDGLQRLTTIQKFIAGELKVFGLKFEQLPKRTILRDLQIVVKVYDFQYRTEMLEFYRDINNGGMAHTHEELSRVDVLIEESKTNGPNWYDKKFTDLELEGLWRHLLIVPLDEDDRLKLEFYDFGIGEHIQNIEDWFDERHSKGLQYLNNMTT